MINIVCATSRKSLLADPLKASSISLLVVAFEISFVKLFTDSESASAAPPTPSFSNISAIVASTCASFASGPQIDSFITSEKVELPVTIAGRDAVISPFDSIALQIASPIISHTFVKSALITCISAA